MRTIELLKIFVLTSYTLSTTAFGILKMSASPSKHVLYDVPVSNNGARCRIILYKKNIPSNEVQIVAPTELGGLKSAEYLKINPQGKMPAMTCVDTGFHLAESDTIARYLLSQYTSTPSFQPELPLSNYICRIHDMYLGPIQSCMYKLSPPFAQFGTRGDAIKEFKRQLDVIEDLLVSETLYLCGDEVSLADATLFPTFVFAKYMLPKFDAAPALPGKLDRWYENIRVKDAVFQKVHDEIFSALEKWNEGGRWDTILGAGLRDTDSRTLFDKIVQGEIPATIVKETEKVLAFKDINPVAPAHILVIPKDRNGLTRLSKATNEHAEILGQLMVVAAEILNDKDLGFVDGGRIVINDGNDGGQEVMHLHLHVIGGRSLTWPPL